MSGACEYVPPSKGEALEQKETRDNEQRERRVDIIRLSALAVVTLVVAWLHLLQPDWLANIAIVVAVIAGGYPIFKESLYALRKGRVNMELSMVIAIVASLVLFQFLPAIVITFFALLSEFVEGFIVEKGRRNIQRLYELAPRKAIVKRTGNNDNGNESTETIEVEGVSVGDIVIVREGDVIPVDAKVVAGSSMVDQSSITGESTPVEKNKDDLVFAGTINQTSRIEVKCEKISTDTTFAKIIHLVEEAEASKAHIQKMSDLMATRLIQFAIGLSVLTYILTQNVISTLSVIVVAGACGLAVGTPIALLATTGKLSKRGIIVKGGLQIERIMNTSTIIFDKTGTPTRGKPIVSQVISFHPDMEPKKVLEYAAIAESNVNHPLARAIEDRARQLNIIMPTNIQDSTSEVVVGRGVTRLHNGLKISVGNLNQMQEILSSARDLTYQNNDSVTFQNLLLGAAENNYYRFLTEFDKNEDQKEFLKYQLTASTTGYVSTDSKIIGAILFEDALRSEARQVISEIKSMGIHVIMLTGDNERIAKQIADKVGIGEYYANLLPQDKVLKIEEIIVKKEQEQNGNSKSKRGIVMVGDGINDAPALAKADVGIAMGKTGTDVAIETADIVLMTEDLKKIPYMINSSRQSILAIRENFFGTLSVDGIGFVLAATGHLNPLLAAFIHIASELAFMVNSARLIMDR